MKEQKAWFLQKAEEHRKATAAQRRAQLEKEARESQAAAERAAAFAAQQAAQAAMARHSQNSSSGGGGQLTEPDARLKERRQKDELIGKIEAMYAAQNRDPPIGLAASSLDALRRHLDHMRTEGGR